MLLSPVRTFECLTHWGRVTHICVNKLTIIGSDNGLSTGRRQAIIWTNAVILLIGTRGTNFNEILIKIHEFSFKEIHLKMSSGKWRPSCLDLNVLNMHFFPLNHTPIWQVYRNKTGGRNHPLPGASMLPVTHVWPSAKGFENKSILTRCDMVKQYDVIQIISPKHFSYECIFIRVRNVGSSECNPK